MKAILYKNYQTNKIMINHPTKLNLSDYIERKELTELNQGKENVMKNLFSMFAT